MGPQTTIPPDADAALDLLSGAEPTAFLTPSLDLSEAARCAAKGLFDCAAVIAASRVRISEDRAFLRELHAQGFDPEQIWLQLDLQSSPLISVFRRRINKCLKKVDGDNPSEFFRIPGVAAENEAQNSKLRKEQDVGAKVDSKSVPDGTNGLAEGEEADFSEEPFSGGEGEGDEAGMEGEEEEPEEGEGGGEAAGKKLPFEDKFLKMEDMERFLEEAEANEGEEDERGIPELYEVGDPLEEDESEESKEGEEGEEDEDGDVTAEDFFGKAALKAEGDDEIRYDDFFGPSGEDVKPSKRKPRRGKKDNDMDGEEEEEEEEEEEGEGEGEEGEEEGQGGGGEDEKEKDPSQMSTHEKRMERLRKQAEELERANLDPKSWTMQGEVAAGKRPKNSALEVELDFEHAQRPPPVITEDVTASLEDLIRQRILEGRFDDVERKKAPVDSTPKERIELDDSKSQRGLAEIYEAEYAQAAGLAPAATSTADAIKRQAALLFKELCMKLDALSHFHFAPKPVIEDMAIKVDVPALAMEEVAPMAVSDASMLAPEEVFAGGGDGGGVRGSAAGAVKTNQELSQEERRRKHRKLKRKRRAELQTKRASQKGREEETASRKGATRDVGTTPPQQTDFTRSAQVFAKLQDSRGQTGEEAKKGGKEQRPALSRSALKL